MQITVNFERQVNVIHLHLGLESGLFISGFHVKNMHLHSSLMFVCTRI
jgi:hypothetical protein